MNESPSSLNVVLATAILAAAAGYFFGTASSLGLFGQKETQDRESWPNSYDVQIHPDSSDEELMAHLHGQDKTASDDSNELKTMAQSSEEFKMVLVVRTDLGMGKGKIAAQASHATLACYNGLQDAPRTSAAHMVLRRWQSRGQAKIALQAGSEDELLLLQAQAVSLGLCAEVIHDAGRTQIASGTATVLGIGPGPKSIVNQVTGHLKLL